MSSRPRTTGKEPGCVLRLVLDKRRDCRAEPGLFREQLLHEPVGVWSGPAPPGLVQYPLDIAAPGHDAPTQMGDNLVGGPLTEGEGVVGLDFGQAGGDDGQHLRGAFELGKLFRNRGWCRVLSTMGYSRLVFLRYPW